MRLKIIIQDIIEREQCVGGIQYGSPGESLETKKVISVRIDSDLMYLTFMCELQLDSSCTVP